MKKNIEKYKEQYDLKVESFKERSTLVRIFTSKLEN